MLKVNKIFLVSLIFLTIILINGVAAADENLTVVGEDSSGDVGVDLIAESVGEVNIEDDSPSLLGDDDSKPELNRSYSLNPNEVDVEDQKLWLSLDIDEKYIYSGGNVSVYFNDSLLTSSDLSWVSYYGLDIDNLPKLDEGEYNLTVKFTGNDYFKSFEDTVPFNVSYKFYPYINGNDYLIHNVDYGSSLEVGVFLPYGAFGKVNVTYGGKNYQVDVFYGSAYLTIDNLLFGKHDIVFQYGDSKYKNKRIVRTINAQPIVNVDPVMTYDSFRAEFIMPEDATGSLSILINGRQFNVSLNKGKAVIPFGNVSLGSYTFIFSYNGDDYSFDPITKTIRAVPKITAPKILWINDEGYIVLQVPSQYSGSIEVYRGFEVFKGNVIKGVGNVKLSGFSDSGENSFQVYFTANTGYKWDTTLTINIVDESPTNYNFNVTVPDIFKYGYDYAVMNIPYAAAGTIDVYIDGKYMNTVYPNDYYCPIYSDDLSIGTHNIEFKYSGDEYFVAKSYKTSFEVVPIKIHCPENILIGQKEDMTLEVSSGAEGYVVLYVDGKYFSSQFVNSRETVLNLHDLTMGSHNWELNYFDYDSTLIYSKTGFFNVAYYNWTVINNHTYGEDIVITVYLPEDATGDVLLTLNNRVYSSKVKNGSAIFTIKDLIGREYLTNVTYSGDDKYPAALILSDFNGYPFLFVSYLIKLSDESIRFDQNTTVSLTLPPDAKGELIVFVNDEQVNKSMVNGKAEITLSDLSIGYNLISCYYGGDDYNVYWREFYIYVSPYTVDISNNQFFINDDEYIFIALPKNATGHLIVRDGYDIYANVSLVDGCAKVPLSDLTLGTHYITATYDGDDFDVVGLYSTEVNVGLKVSMPNEMNVGGNDKLVIALPEGATGVPIVYFYGKNNYKDLEADNGIINLNSLASDEYEVYISYYDDNYGSIYNFFDKLTVKKQESEIFVSLIDGDKSTLIEFDEKLTGDLLIIVNKEVRYQKINQSSIILDNSGLGYGNHKVEVIYSGDDVYDSCKNHIDFVFYKKTGISITLIDGYVVTCVLNDCEGISLPNFSVYYSLNGAASSKVNTDSHGQFKLKAANNSKLTMSFSGFDFYLPSSAVFTFKNMVPVKLGTQIIVANSFTRTAVDFPAGEKGQMFYFTLKDEKGKVLANKEAKIGVSGKIYNVKTDKNGKAGLMINLANANVYTYAISFLGDDEYKASFEVSKLTVVKKAVTITPAKTSYTFKSAAKSKVITATLKSTNKFIPSGKKAIVSVGGKIYSATIAKNGKISFNIGTVTKKGTYKISIRYAGDVTYKAAVGKTITVKIT